MCTESCTVINIADVKGDDTVYYRLEFFRQNTVGNFKLLRNKVELDMQENNTRVVSCCLVMTTEYYGMR